MQHWFVYKLTLYLEYTELRPWILQQLSFVVVHEEQDCSNLAFGTNTPGRWVGTILVKKFLPENTTKTMTTKLVLLGHMWLWFPLRPAIYGLLLRPFWCYLILQLGSIPLYAHDFTEHFGNKLLGVWPFANFKWRSVTSPLIFLFLCDESWKKVLCTYTHSYTHELQIYQGCIFSYKSSTGLTNFKVTTLALGFTDGEAYSWLLFPTQQNGVGG